MNRNIISSSVAMSPSSRRKMTAALDIAQVFLSLVFVYTPPYDEYGHEVCHMNRTFSISVSILYTAYNNRLPIKE